MITDIAVKNANQRKSGRSEQRACLQDLGDDRDLPQPKPEEAQALDAARIIYGGNL